MDHANFMKTLVEVKSQLQYKTALTSINANKNYSTHKNSNNNHYHNKININNQRIQSGNKITQHHKKRSLQQVTVRTKYEHMNGKNKPDTTKNSITISNYNTNANSTINTFSPQIVRRNNDQASIQQFSNQKDALQSHYDSVKRIQRSDKFGITSLDREQNIDYHQRNRASQALSDDNYSMFGMISPQSKGEKKKDKTQIQKRIEDLQKLVQKQGINNQEVQLGYQELKDFVEQKTNSYLLKGMLRIASKILKKYERFHLKNDFIDKQNELFATRVTSADIYLKLGVIDKSKNKIEQIIIHLNENQNKVNKYPDNLIAKCYALHSQHLFIEQLYSDSEASIGKALDIIKRSLDKQKLNKSQNQRIDTKSPVSCEQEGSNFMEKIQNIKLLNEQYLNYLVIKKQILLEQKKDEEAFVCDTIAQNFAIENFGAGSQEHQKIQKFKLLTKQKSLKLSGKSELKRRQIQSILDNARKNQLDSSIERSREKGNIIADFNINALKKEQHEDSQYSQRNPILESQNSLYCQAINQIQNINQDSLEVNIFKSNRRSQQLSTFRQQKLQQTPIVQQTNSRIKEVSQSQEQPFNSQQNYLRESINASTESKMKFNIEKQRLNAIKNKCLKVQNFHKPNKINQSGVQTQEQTNHNQQLGLFVNQYTEDIDKDEEIKVNIVQEQLIIGGLNESSITDDDFVRDVEDQLSNLYVNNTGNNVSAIGTIITNQVAPSSLMHQHDLQLPFHQQDNNNSFQIQTFSQFSIIGGCGNKSNNQQRSSNLSKNRNHNNNSYYQSERGLRNSNENSNIGGENVDVPYTSDQEDQQNLHSYQRVKSQTNNQQQQQQVQNNNNNELQARNSQNQIQTINYNNLHISRQLFEDNVCDDITAVRSLHHHIYEEEKFSIPSAIPTQRQQEREARNSIFNSPNVSNNRNQTLGQSNIRNQNVQEDEQNQVINLKQQKPNNQKSRQSQNQRQTLKPPDTQINGRRLQSQSQQLQTEEQKQQTANSDYNQIQEEEDFNLLQKQNNSKMIDINQNSQASNTQQQYNMKPISESEKLLKLVKIQNFIRRKLKHKHKQFLLNKRTLIFQKLYQMKYHDKQQRFSIKVSTHNNLLKVVISKQFRSFDNQQNNSVDLQPINQRKIQDIEFQLAISLDRFSFLANQYPNIKIIDILRQLFIDCKDHQYEKLLQILYQEQNAYDQNLLRPNFQLKQKKVDIKDNSFIKSNQTAFDQLKENLDLQKIPSSPRGFIEQSNNYALMGSNIKNQSSFGDLSNLPQASLFLSKDKQEEQKNEFENDLQQQSLDNQNQTPKLNTVNTPNPKQESLETQMNKSDHDNEHKHLILDQDQKLSIEMINKQLNLKYVKQVQSQQQTLLINKQSGIQLQIDNSIEVRKRSKRNSLAIKNDQIPLFSDLDQQINQKLQFYHLQDQDEISKMKSVRLRIKAKIRNALYRQYQKYQIEPLKLYKSKQTNNFNGTTIQLSHVFFKGKHMIQQCVDSNIDHVIKAVQIPWRDINRFHMSGIKTEDFINYYDYDHITKDIVPLIEFDKNLDKSQQQNILRKVSFAFGKNEKQNLQKRNHRISITNLDTGEQTKDVQEIVAPYKNNIKGSVNVWQIVIQGQTTIDVGNLDINLQPLISWTLDIADNTYALRARYNIETRQIRIDTLCKAFIIFDCPLEKMIENVCTNLRPNLVKHNKKDQVWVDECLKILGKCLPAIIFIDFENKKIQMKQVKKLEESYVEIRPQVEYYENIRKQDNQIINSNSQDKKINNRSLSLSDNSQQDQNSIRMHLSAVNSNLTSSTKTPIYGDNIPLGKYLEKNVSVRDKKNNYISQDLQEQEQITKKSTFDTKKNQPPSNPLIEAVRHDLKIQEHEYILEYRVSRYSQTFQLSAILLDKNEQPTEMGEKDLQIKTPHKEQKLDRSDLIRYITILHTYIKNNGNCDSIQDLETILGKKHLIRGQSRRQASQI